MRDLDSQSWQPAQVPGSVYLDLAACKVIDFNDLLRRPDDYQWIATQDWVWRRTFEIERPLEGYQAELVFEGIDTVSHIWLNDKLIGKTDNMFVAHRFDVSELVRQGRHRLMVKILSPLTVADRRMERYGMLSSVALGDPRRVYVRKAQYQFGSTFGPAMPAGGIFAPVALHLWKIARLEDVCARVLECNQHTAELRVEVTVQRQQHQAPLSILLRLDGGGLDMRQTIPLSAQRSSAVAVLHIERPILWQPHTHGVPHLYRLTVELKDQADHMLDCRQMNVGICAIHAVDPENPSQIVFEVNGQRVYAKGAVWAPLAMLACQPTEAQYRRVLTDLKKAHINLLRVWGGGYYEQDIFYDLCDQLGIMVWQDFMFASAYYPDRSFFTSQVAAEAEAVIRRLRNHPCLAVWCGNSHIDLLHSSGKLGKGKKFYGKAIYHHLLPEKISQFDPLRDYVPSVPYSGAGAKDHNAPLVGTSHCWTVWNQYAPVSEYLFDSAQMPRFLAEFGSQSLPCRDTLQRAVPKEKLYLGSPVLDRIGYQTDSAARLARYAAGWFAPPKELDQWILQTQLSQAKSVAVCAEHLRAHQALNSGLMIWTATEPMPAIGFGMLDAGGWPKALYYYARRFFAPRLVTVIQRKPFLLSGAMCGGAVVVVNDHSLPLTATVQCQCLDFYGNRIDQAQFPIAVGPFSHSAPWPLPRGLAVPPTPHRAALYLAVATDKGIVTENLLFYLPPKELVWPQRRWQATLQRKSERGYELTLTCSGLAADVCILPPAPAQISDNFFFLLPHQPKTVRIEYEKPIDHWAATPQVMSASSDLP